MVDVDRVKLRPPRANHAIVGHERLLALRPEPSASPVVAVIAPAGYGKSTLLAEWADHERGRAVWITLDRHDDDPIRLVTHLAVVVLESGVSAPQLEEGLRSPGSSVWSRLMPRLSSAMQSAGSFALFIDDAHTLTSDESWDVIDWLALHIPPGSQLAIAGRALGGTVMPRLTVDGQAATLGAADLALLDAEAHELLRATGAASSLADATRLNRACDGWVAGLLLSSSVAGWEGPVVADSDTQDDLLGEYVQAEVLQQLSGEDQEFLLRTSVLRLASAPLCDAILGRSDSGDVLERLCLSNTFTSRVGKGWCRTHELVRSALLRTIEERDEALVAQLRERAATWHAEHGSPADAVSYAMESGHLEYASGLIGRFANALFSSGQWTMVSRWFDWVEAHGLTVSDRSVMVAAATGSALTGDPERSVRWALASERSRPDEGTVDEGLRILTAAWQCQRGARTMLADATRAVELIPEASPWRKSALAALGLALLMHDHEPESAVTFRRVVDEPGPAWADVAARSACLAFLAILALRRQDLDEAVELLERATIVRQESGITEQGLQALVNAAMARAILLRDGPSDEVARLLSQAQRVRQLVSWAMPAPALATRLELIKAHLAIGDIAGARVVVREARDILRRRPGLGALEAETNDLALRVAEQAETLQGPSSLTAAELRLLPWLATHLSFREIGERLYLSTNTVKTEALSIYRKLGASSRSEAVEAAVRVGLLDAASLAGILAARTWTRPDVGDSPVRDD